MIRLKELRRLKGINQDEVASAIGLSRAAYTNLENGKRETNFTTLVTLADFFGVTVDYLLGREEKTVPADGGEDVKSVFPEVFIKAYQELNDEGREKVIEYATDLAASGRYRKKADKHEMGKAANE